jgi:pimeloyl-ACP methyl ester carboxylesterase
LSTIARWAKPAAGASPVATNGSDRRSAATVGDLNSERSRGWPHSSLSTAPATPAGTGISWKPNCANGATTPYRRIFRDDDSAGLPEYADTVVDAIGDRTNLIVVAQSLGAFTAPLVCDRVAVQLLVLIAPMIPAPGEAPADYWTHTKYGEEVRERYDDEIALFYQDVAPELAAEALKRGCTQSEARLGEPSPLKAWPDVPTRVLICRDDRLFPARFLRRVARERLGIKPDEIDGGHPPH